jgi:hypothetical protein
MVLVATLTDALIWEAGIDGKTGSNARHVEERLHDLIYRQYRLLRSLVTQNGEEFFRTRGEAQPLPGRAEGEDYILVPFPEPPSYGDEPVASVCEIISVDVQLGGTWHELTPSSRRQWRVFPGANRPGSPGEWSTVSMPQPTSNTPTEGGIAIWPPSLTGNYAIDFVPDFVQDTAALILLPYWQEWLLCSCTMVISQRDNNKRNMFVDARDRKAEAQAQIIAHSRRSKRGSVVARRRDGVEL